LPIAFHIPSLSLYIRLEFPHDSFSSAVINDFNIFCTRFRPTKADTPLSMDTKPVLSGPVAFKRFQPISGAYSQILDASGNLKLSQFPSGDRFYIDESLNAKPF
jgi:hypothetical protein